MTVTFSTGERLTPDEVQSVSFPPARLGSRGYHEEHVRAFCAQVEGELITLLNEKAALWEEVEQLRRRVHGDAGDELGYRPEGVHVQAVHILSHAQQTADRCVADAQQYSRHLAEDARHRRDEVLAEAREHAEQVLEEAHSQATRAAEMAMAGPGVLTTGVRLDLTAEVAYLRTFGDVYRTHLWAYLEALLRNMGEWDRAERSSLAAARVKLPFLPAAGVR